MARSNQDLLAIKAELTNDPQALGLTINPADDEANANALSLVRPTILIKRRSLSTSVIFSNITAGVHQALTDQQARWLNSVLLLGQIDPFLAVNIRDGLSEMLGETDSATAVAGLMDQNGNRIDQMFQAGLLQQGGTVNPSEIANARNAT